MPSGDQSHRPIPRCTRLFAGTHNNLFYLLAAISGYGASASVWVANSGASSVCLPLNCQACSKPLTCTACTSKYFLDPLGQCSLKTIANAECTAFSLQRNSQCKTFEDLPSNIFIPFSSYAGLTWNNFYAWNPDEDSEFSLGTG